MSHGFVVDITDPEGRELIPPRVVDRFRHRPVWATYKFRRGCQRAEARCSGFLDLASAKAAVDELNGNRAEESHYFKVCRSAIKDVSE